MLLHFPLKLVLAFIQVHSQYWVFNILKYNPKALKIGVKYHGLKICQGVGSVTPTIITRYHLFVTQLTVVVSWLLCMLVAMLFTHIEPVVRLLGSLAAFFIFILPGEGYQLTSACPQPNFFTRPFT